MPSCSARSADEDALAALPPDGTTARDLVRDALPAQPVHARHRPRPQPRARRRRDCGELSPVRRAPSLSLGDGETRTDKRKRDRYGDHLYGKADYEGAMAAYLKTVGTVQASYVIRKVRFLPLRTCRPLQARSPRLGPPCAVPRRPAPDAPHVLPPRAALAWPRQQRHHDAPPELLRQARRRRRPVALHPLLVRLVRFLVRPLDRRHRNRRTPLRPRHGDPGPATSGLLHARELARRAVPHPRPLPPHRDRGRR